MLRYQIIVLITIVVSYTAARANFEDVKQVIADYTRAIDDYVTLMQNAEDVEDVVEAINNYSQDAKKIIPELRKVAKEYPELMNEQELPTEIEQKITTFIENYKKLGTVFVKPQKHMTDSDVQKSIQELIRFTEGYVK